MRRNQPTLHHRLSRAALVAWIALLCWSTTSIAAQRKHSAASPDTQGGEQKIERLFNEAQETHAKGDLPRALDLYNHVLALQPDLYQVHYQRAVALRSLGKTDEAEAALRKTLGLQPTYVRAQVALGELLIERQRLTDARPLLEKAVAAEPENARAHRAFARLCLAEKQYNLAAEHLVRAASIDPGNGSIYVDLAFAQKQSGDRVGALQSLARALQINPSNVDALRLRSGLEREAKDFRAAANDAEAIGKLSPSVENEIDLASLYRDAGETEKALQVCTRATASYPSSRALQVAEADLLLQLHRNDEARPILQKLVETDPTDKNSLAALADAVAPKDPATAVELYRRALEIDPRDQTSRARYGASLIRVKRFAEAAAELERVLTSSPDEAQARRSLAAAYFELDRFGDAATQFRWLVAHQPDTALPYYFLGICFDKLQHLQAALSSYEAFIARADARQNKNEIDNASFRIPQLKRLIERLNQKKPKKK